MVTIYLIEDKSCRLWSAYYEDELIGTSQSLADGVFAVRQQQPHLAQIPVVICDGDDCWWPLSEALG